MLAQYWHGPGTAGEREQERVMLQGSGAQTWFHALAAGWTVSAEPGGVGGAWSTFVLRVLQRSQLTAVRFLRTFCLMFLEGACGALWAESCAVGMAAGWMEPRRERGKGWDGGLRVEGKASTREVGNAGKLHAGVTA